MGVVGVHGNTGASRFTPRLKRWLAGVAAVSLVAGTFVMVGVQRALAESFSPDVTTSPENGPYLAGEDVNVLVDIQNNGGSAQFNLSVGVLFPSNVTFIEADDAFGQPQKIYAAGTRVPSQGAVCGAVGLDAGPGTDCTVPSDKQYLVFPNISDLPQGSSNGGTLTVRPNAQEFPVGAQLDVTATAFTSSHERFIPSFPGSGGNGGSAHTSGAGVGIAEIPVQALRLEKSEPSPENELLRGVHNNTTTYTLRVWHTGEGDINDLVVTDFLPAGLEYLGLGGAENTSDANGTRGEGAEYPGAASLIDTPAPHDSFYAGDRALTGSASLNAAAGSTERVETIIPTEADLAAFPTLEAGKVYTKVTWNVGELLAQGLAGYSLLDSVKQDYASAAGQPGFFEIRYRAAVPLFENTLDFGGDAPSPESGQQGSNLDNNRGASTRQGEAMNSVNGAPQELTNVAGADGTYAGSLASGTDAAVQDRADYTVTAMDVRVLKSVNDNEFVQGNLATYTLDVATSEYTAADLGEPGDSSADVRPNRFTDDLGDGICPAIPGGLETDGTNYPRLLIGDPRPGNVIPEEQDFMSPEAWTAALSQLGADCAYPSQRDGAALSGATLSGIAFDPETGHFFLDLHLDSIAAATGNGHDGGSEGHLVTYTAAQNSLYVKNDNEPGATTSGDSVMNTVSMVSTTTSIPKLDEVSSAEGAQAGGEFRAEDDSHAVLEAPLSRLEKQVLNRDANIPDGDITKAALEDWNPEVANGTFAAGDNVWWRITVTPPTGADVRAPILQDFLPEGTEFDDTKTGDRYDNIVYAVSSENPLGTCDSLEGTGWLGEFVEDPVYDSDARSLTWKLGSKDCGVADSKGQKFFPRNTTLDVYIQVRVVDVEAFAAVDLSQNLAKYQQRNVTDEIFFLRDDASITVDRSARLVKGIRSINGEAVANGTAFGGNVDGLEVVQGDEVTYRLDITAPRNTTEGYLVWDVLPEGISAADVKNGSYTASLVEAGAEVSGASVEFSVNAYDAGNYPEGVSLKAEFADRSIIVWNVTSEVPGSAPDTVDENGNETAGVTRGLTLGYTIAVPSGAGAAGALVAQTYKNDASIVEFGVHNNDGATSRVVVDGSDNVAIPRTPAENERAFVFEDTNNDTSDPSDIFLPNADMTKTLVRTEIRGDDSTTPNDSRNLDEVIVQGEYATYDISVTIPANTTVRNGVLADTGNLVGQSGNGTMTPNTVQYQLHEASVTAANGQNVTSQGTDPSAAHASEFIFNETTGKLFFPEYYQNDTGEDQIFTVQLTVWVKDIDATHQDDTPDADRPQIPNGKVLRNTAFFDSQKFDDGANSRVTGTADVTYREPNLEILKTAASSGDDIDAVTIDDTITYTLEVRNVDRVKSYDNVVIDEVPEGLLVQPGNFKIGITSDVDAATTIEVPASDLVIEPGALAGTGGTITWDSAKSSLSELAEVPSSVFLFYDVKINVLAAAGDTYTNTAQVAGYTLPGDLDQADTRRGDRISAAERDITATTALIDKTVRIKPASGPGGAYTESVSAPIGETVQYKVDVTLNAYINYFDIEVRDTLSAGVELQTDTVKVEMTTGDGGAVNVTEDWTREGNDPNHVWKYTKAGTDGDITSSTETRVLTFTYDVLLKNSVAQNVNSLPNTAGATWATTNGGTKRDPLTDPAGVTVVNPLLSIQKDVKHANDPDTSYKTSEAGEVDQKFTYRVNVTNATGSNRSDAHNTVVTDTVPQGVVVDESTFKIDGVAATAVQASMSGDTITWNIAGPIAPGATVSLSYDATFADSTTLMTNELVNTAKVTEYESFAEGGRTYTPTGVEDTASVTPRFPAVHAEKAVETPASSDVDYGLAYVGEPFGWKLTVTNTGDGVASAVDVVDALPANWSYVAGTAQVNAQPLADPTQDAAGSNTTLTWSAAALDNSITDGLFPLAAGGSFVVTFDAKPNDAAVETPGTGLEVGVNPHTNTVAVTNVKDAQDKTSNKDGDYAGDGDTADAYIAEADLLLEKVAIGGTSAAIELSDGTTLDAGSWVAGASAGQELLPAAAGTDAVNYAQPQWQLTVTNHGPDASFGAFTLTEQQTLPAGVTVTDWQATYFASGADNGTALPIVVEGSGANLDLTVGDATTSLQADGSDRIVITANVNIPAGTVATAEQLKNTAYVEGETFERDAHKNPERDPKNPNSDEAGKAVATAADLAIVKQFTGDTTGLNAGDIVNWTLTVTNNGPSHSLSRAGDGAQIVVIDDVPAEIIDAALVEGSLPVGWAVAQDGQKFSFTLTPDAQLDSGASVTFSFTGRIDGSVTAGTTITNAATVTPGDTPDTDETNNEDNDSVGPETAHTSVAAVKERVVYDAATGAWVSAGDTQVTAGSQVNYRLQLTNTGDYVPARGVTLTDALPEYLAFNDWAAETPAGGWELDNSAGTLVFTNPGAVIDPHASASVIITATVAADYRAEVENSVCVTTGNLDPAQSTADDCVTDSTAFDKSVDWALLKSHVTPAQDAPAVAGEAVRYRLVLNNHGPSVSDGPITITDVLPEGFSFAGNVTATGATLSEAVVDGQIVTWTAEGPFAVGDSVVTVEFDAVVAENTAAGAFENAARVDGAGDEPDSNPTNNDDTDEVSVIRDAQLHLAKEVQSIDGAWGETAEHAAGTQVTWRVKITNSGSSAVPAVFTDDLALAPGVTLVSVDGGNDWEWNEAEQALVYVANDGLFPVTAADESNAAWITITTSVDAGTPPTAEQPLVNWGKVVWIDDTTNPDEPDNGNSTSDDAEITVVRSADLGLIKQVRDAAPAGDWIDADNADTAGAVTAGESTTYRVLVTNNGPSDAVAPLTVRDVLPEGAVFEGIVSDANESGMPEWSADYDADTNTVTFTRDARYGGLAVGADALAFEYEVAFAASIESGAVLENTAEFDEETLTVNGDANPSNNADPANVVVDRQIDLGIEKTHNADAVRIGDELPFTIDVTNYGPSEASGIIVTDTVPAGLEVVSDEGAVRDGEGEPTGWTIESITLNDDGTTTVIASYDAPLAPGESATPLVITTLVTPASYDTVTNVVDVAAAEPEPEHDSEHPNHTEDTVVVPPQVTLSVEKSAVGEFKVGETGTYEIAVSNHGPTLDPGPITVTDELPEGLSFDSAPDLPAGVTVEHSRGTVTWTLTEPLGVGETVVLTLHVNVHKAAYEQPGHEVTNTVVIDSESELTPDSELEDSVTVQVDAADPLVLTGSDIAGGVLAAIALLLLGGGTLYALGRRRQGAHAA